jgi:diadenosine tetraphosphatase ApaH/serine/threonine PP2A family protein phosphatase
VRIAVLSDIHANLDALDAVLKRCREEDVGPTFVTGDIVGYGAEPQEVIDRVAELPGVRMVAGNHDLAVVERFDLDWFNRVAAAVVRWTRGVLAPSGRALLERLEPRSTGSTALLVHGSVVDPAAEYLLDEERAAASFGHEGFELCFFGHTHLPTLFVEADGRVAGEVPSPDSPVEMQAGRRYLVNPGSIGQPRDGDPRASFLIYDTEARRAVWHRVPYPVEEAQRKIRDAGLPDVLAERLAVGR